MRLVPHNNALIMARTLCVCVCVNLYKVIISTDKLE